MVAKAKAKGKTASDTLDLKKCHCTLQLSHQCKHTNRSGHTQTHTLTHTLTQRECCGQQPFWPASLAKRKGHLSTETRDNRKRADTHTHRALAKNTQKERRRERNCKLTPFVLCACTASLPLSPRVPGAFRLLTRLMDCA